MKSEYTQIFETIDIGLIILDRDMLVTGWNRWMEHHSGISSRNIVGKSILDVYPTLRESKYTRLFKSVLSFGNYALFSQKLHKHLIPLNNPHESAEQMPLMPQNCTANPVRNEKGDITGLFITVYDVTDYVTYEQKLLDMTKLDPLTRLYNRSHLEKRFSEELERARRHGNIFSVIMIDIDFFKKINDSYGHLCGDQTLRQLAKMLQQMVRAMDIVSRYGGEEFCCVLPETRAENALVLAERLRSAVEASDILYGDEKFRITISLGIAEYSPERTTREELVGAADAALYRAKHEGRNRVVCAGDPTVENIVHQEATL